MALPTCIYNRTKYAPAIKELLNLLEQQKKIGNNRIHYTTDLLSHAYAKTGNHKESLRYAIASLDHSINTGDTVLISYLLPTTGL